MAVIHFHEIRSRSNSTIAIAETCHLMCIVFVDPKSFLKTKKKIEH